MAFRIQSLHLITGIPSVEQARQRVTEAEILNLSQLSFLLRYISENQDNARCFSRLGLDWRRTILKIVSLPIF